MNRFLFGVLAVAAVLRFTGLGHESYWYDEAISLFNAQAPFFGVPHEVAVRDVSPPFYFLVLAAWIRVFGTGEVGARALSALGSTVALVFFYRVARRLAGERPARYAAVLYAVAPFALRFAQEARMYGLLLPLTWGAFDLLGHELERPQPRYGRLALVHLALLYTHAFGAFVPLLSLAAVWWLRGTREAGRLALWLTPVALAFAPWARVMAAQARARAGGFWIGVPDHAAVHYLVYVLAGGGPDARDVPVVLLASRVVARLAYVVVAGGAVCAWYCRAQDPRRWDAARIALLGIGLPVSIVFVVSQFGQPLFVDRYFLFLAPFFWLALALGFAALPGRAGAAALGTYLALLAPVVADHYTRPHKAQWREAVAFAEASGMAPETIVDTGGMMVLMAYLPRPHAPHHTTALEGFPPGELAPAALMTRLGGARAFWMFFSSHSRDPQKYRTAVKQVYEEVAYQPFMGVAVGCYRKRAP